VNFSYWEQKSWFTAVDFTVVGSGIVGLSCALRLREKFPKANILVLERGILPQGASTKNAGFACFGSISEILDDLKTHTEEEVVELVRQRIEGLQLLRETLGDTQLDYQELGGYELFTLKDKAMYQACLDKVGYVNALLFPLFNKEVYEVKPNTFGFTEIQERLIFNSCEGQIDTGKMMEALLAKAQANGIKVLNNCTVKKYQKHTAGIAVSVNDFEFITQHVCIATNGFAKQLEISEVQPARAQVLITKPIKDLKTKGTFHLDKGYYYFRNIDNRILLGGGRNLDFTTEQTTKMAQTPLVQTELERLLKEVILPNTPFEIDYSWSGIMGVGAQKKPIVKQLEPNVYCGVRLGGMGVAIGSAIGRELAEMVER
jgi:glycine/D-amino acid oxidase-like deaminating enzyme